MTQRRHISAGWLFAAPALLLIIIYLVYPTLWTIRLSFFGGPGFIPTRFVGLDNYTRLFTEDPYFLNNTTVPPSGTALQAELRPQRPSAAEVRRKRDVCTPCGGETPPLHHGAPLLLSGRAPNGAPEDRVREPVAPHQFLLQ